MSRKQWEVVNAMLGGIPYALLVWVFVATDYSADSAFMYAIIVTASIVLSAVGRALIAPKLRDQESAEQEA